MHAWSLRRQMDRPLERRRRLVEVLPLLLYDAEDPVRRRKMRVQLDRVIALFERGLEGGSIERNPGGAARHNRRDWIERLRHDHLVERFVEPAERRETRHRIPVM